MIPIWFVIILLVLALLTLAAFKRGPFARRSAAGDFRHPVVRILCAVLLLAILGATAWFTWLEHTPSASPPPTVLAPTRPPKPWPDSAPFASLDPGPCKLVFTAYLLDPTARNFWAESTVIRWPEDRDRTFQINAASFRIDFEAAVQISGFDRRAPGQEVFSQGLLRLRGSHWSQSGGLSNAVEKMHVETNLTSRSDDRHPLCLVPHGNESYVIAYQISRADADDPLREVTGFTYEKPAIENALARQIGIRRLASTASPGVKMLEHAGPASFLLLLAAVFGAQCFRRRGIAFTALLAGMVLYAGTLDYAIMRRHAARAMDESLQPGERQSATIQARQTFFHQAAAKRLRGD